MATIIIWRSVPTSPDILVVDKNCVETSKRDKHPIAATCYLSFQSPVSSLYQQKLGIAKGKGYNSNGYFVKCCLRENLKTLYQITNLSGPWFSWMTILYIIQSKLWQGRYYPHQTGIGFPIKRCRPHCSAGSVGQRLPGYCCYCGVHYISNCSSSNQILPKKYLPSSESFSQLTDNRTLSRHSASWNNQHRNYIFVLL